jgi:hypothetical protein
MNTREVVSESIDMSDMSISKHDFICEYVLSREGDPVLIVQEANKIWEQIQEVCE